MYDYYLKTNSKEEMLKLLLDANILIKLSKPNEPLFVVTNTNYIVYNIGHIILNEALYDEDKNIVTSEIKDESWHVNLRCLTELSENQKNILPLINPQPKTPREKFI